MQLHERWDKSYRMAMQSTIDLVLNIFAQRSVDKIEKQAEHQFQHASDGAVLVCWSKE